MRHRGPARGSPPAGLRQRRTSRGARRPGGGRWEAGGAGGWGGPWRHPPPLARREHAPPRARAALPRAEPARVEPRPAAASSAPAGGQRPRPRATDSPPPPGARACRGRAPPSALLPARSAAGPRLGPSLQSHPGGGSASGAGWASCGRDLGSWCWCCTAALCTLSPSPEAAQVGGRASPPPPHCAAAPTRPPPAEIRLGPRPARPRPAPLARSRREPSRERPVSHPRPLGLLARWAPLLKRGLVGDGETFRCAGRARSGDASSP